MLKKKKYSEIISRVVRINIVCACGTEKNKRVLSISEYGVVFNFDFYTMSEAKIQLGGGIWSVAENMWHTEKMTVLNVITVLYLYVNMWFTIFGGKHYSTLLPIYRRMHIKRDVRAQYYWIDACVWMFNGGRTYRQQ